MRIRRTLPIALGVVIVAAAVTLAVQLRKHAPPESARLLPGGDAFLCLNLSWARKANGGNNLPAVSHDPEYERFIQQTGIEFERDLDADAFTIPLEGRAFRIAILSVDSVAASNQDDPAVIRGMVDRSRRLASPFGGPALLRRHYKRVQFASPVWMVAHIQPSAPAFGGWSAVFPKPADLGISASSNPLHLPCRPGSLHVRAEAMAGAGAA